jgi:hypothetical protein
MTSSGLMPFIFDFAIFSTAAVSFSPVAFKVGASPLSSTSESSW